MQCNLHSADHNKLKSHLDFLRSPGRVINETKLDVATQAGWAGMLQHYFFAAWVPQADQPANYELAHVGDLYSISAAGPQFTVPAGGSASSTAAASERIRTRRDERMRAMFVRVEVGVGRARVARRGPAQPIR